MTPPPRNQAEAPGTASSAADTSPPEDDSETATVQPFSFKSAAQSRAGGSSVSRVRPSVRSATGPL